MITAGQGGVIYKKKGELKVKFKPVKKRSNRDVEYIETASEVWSWFDCSDQNPTVGYKFVGPVEGSTKGVDIVVLAISAQCFGAKDLDDLIAFCEFAKSVIEEAGE